MRGLPWFPVSKSSPHLTHKWNPRCSDFPQDHSGKCGQKLKASLQLPKSFCFLPHGRCSGNQPVLDESSWDCHGQTWESPSRHPRERMTKKRVVGFGSLVSTHSSASPGSHSRSEAMVPLTRAHIIPAMRDDVRTVDKCIPASPPALLSLRLWHASLRDALLSIEPGAHT